MQLYASVLVLYGVFASDIFHPSFGTTPPPVKSAEHLEILCGIWSFDSPERY